MMDETLSDIFVPTAPVVGQHKMNTSIAGFDPLFEKGNGKTYQSRAASMPFIMASTSPSRHRESRSPPPTTASPSLSPKAPNQERSGSPDIAAGLSSIAIELGKATPEPAFTSEKKQRKRFSLGGKAGVASPGGASGNKLNILTWSKKKSNNNNGKAHRRSSSLTGGNGKGLWQDCSNTTATRPGVISRNGSLASADNTTNRLIKSACASPLHPVTKSCGNTPVGGATSPMISPMMRELWSLHQEQELQQPALSPFGGASSGTETNHDSLALPCLAKPRPTSFLTGKDAVRTSEQDATDWQLGIPERSDFQATAKLAHFLETYCKEECLLDLTRLKGASRLDMAAFASGLKPSLNSIADCHRPIVEALVDCDADMVQVHGHIVSGDNSSASDPSSRREVLIIERQRQILCMMRGTMAEQHGKFLTKPHQTVEMDDCGNIKAFTDRRAALGELELRAFDLLDRLTEDNPFCDVCFAGHGFGGAMATLAAYRFASARPELRVATIVTAAPKVGLEDLRMSAHSLPNLKAFRVELAAHHAALAAGAGMHLGHTVRISCHPPAHKIKVFRFGEQPQDAPRASLRLHMNKRDRDVADYIAAYDELPRWAVDFYRQDGAGVRGRDNEERQMV